MVNLRKRLEANEGVKGLLQDPIAIDDLIAKAREDLSRAKTRQQIQNEDKSKYEFELEEKLQHRIASTKEWYKKRKALMAGIFAL